MPGRIMEADGGTRTNICFHTVLTDGVRVGHTGRATTVELLPEQLMSLIFLQNWLGGQVGEARMEVIGGTLGKG